jgi:hypothetical protein
MGGIGARGVAGTNAKSGSGSSIRLWENVNKYGQCDGMFGLHTACTTCAAARCLCSSLDRVLIFGCHRLSSRFLLFWMRDSFEPWVVGKNEGSLDILGLMHNGYRLLFPGLAV